LQKEKNHYPQASKRLECGQTLKRFNPDMFSRYEKFSMTKAPEQNSNPIFKLTPMQNSAMVFFETVRKCYPDHNTDEEWPRDGYIYAFNAMSIISPDVAFFLYC